MKTPTRMKARIENDQVSSLMVPVQNKSLLIPNVLIAEVIPMQAMQSSQSSPPWLLGDIHWRGEQVPVLSFEIANSQVHGQDSSNARLAVFNCVTGQTKYKFFAVVVQGIPRMVKLTDHEVREDKQTSVGQAEKMAVITQLGKAIIPDVEYLESLVSRIS